MMLSSRDPYPMTKFHFLKASDVCVVAFDDTAQVALSLH